MLNDKQQANSDHDKKLPEPYVYPYATVASLFRQMARTRPMATALRFGDQAVSYAALDRASDHIAQQLCALGHRSGDVVGIAMKRTPQLVAALLGILKADGAYMPLDPDWPSSRLEIAVRNSKAQLLLADKVEAFPVLAGIRIISPDAVLVDITRWANLDTTAPSPMAGADDIAYVNFTSGSSGEPKGVMVPHRGITSLLFHANYTELSTETVTLFHAPPYFDGMTFELWAPLLHGGTAVLFDSDYPNVSRLRRAIRENHVTVLLCTAALFNVIVDTAPDTFETLSAVMTGGESLSPSHVRAAAEAHNHLRITNVYGPTEATTFSTFFDVSALAPDTVSVPIGVAANNRSVFIAGPDLVPVPQGQIGEICVAGPGVALGYIGRPDLTAERFVMRSGPEGQLEPVYRTGDLGRYNEQGLIEFCGRNDNQIKLNGYRIELEEIERCLIRHTDVRQALAVVHGEGTRRALKVLIVGADVDTSTLMDFSSHNLPRHMLPSEYQVVEALPLKPNGKVDRGGAGRRIVRCCLRPIEPRREATMRPPPLSADRMLEPMPTRHSQPPNILAGKSWTKQTPSSSIGGIRNTPKVPADKTPFLDQFHNSTYFSSRPGKTMIVAAPPTLVALRIDWHRVTRLAKLRALNVPVLDPCCGSRMFWFDRSAPRAHAAMKAVSRAEDIFGYRP